jgi:uncharacterized protein YecE (DUF72 family)
MSDRRKVVPIKDPTGFLFETAAEVAATQQIERPFEVKGARIGTSAFTAAGWPGSFYPANMKPRDYLSYYATKFNSVEIDSTFYACPPAERFNAWYEATPPDFLFSLKVPQTITHEKCLQGCEQEVEEFIAGSDLLHQKRGPLLLQFGFFSESVFEKPSDFYKRLRFFLQKYSRSTIRFSVEIRNKDWLTAEFADLLREHKVALVLQDQSWMPIPEQMAFDYFTADFTYIRLLGDRKGIEKQTKVWDKPIVNRTRELWNWLDICQRAVRRGATVFFYVNNHYAGHAPATAEQFVKMWQG